MHSQRVPVRACPLDVCPHPCCCSFEVLEYVTRAQRQSLQQTPLPPPPTTTTITAGCAERARHVGARPTHRRVPAAGEAARRRAQGQAGAGGQPPRGDREAKGGELLLLLLLLCGSISVSSSSVAGASSAACTRLPFRPLDPLLLSRSVSLCIPLSMSRSL